MIAIESILVEGLDQFLAYTRKRIADPDLAADTLQDSLLKALRAAPELREKDRLLPWFYRILDNSIKDAYRRTGRERSRKEALDFEPVGEDSEDDDAILCACFRRLIPDLKAEYAAVLNLVDLGEADSDVAAEQLGISKDNPESAAISRPSATARATRTNVPGLRETRVFGLHMQRRTHRSSLICSSLSDHRSSFIAHR